MLLEATTTQTILREISADLRNAHQRVSMQLRGQGPSFYWNPSKRGGIARYHLSVSNPERNTSFAAMRSKSWNLNPRAWSQLVKMLTRRIFCRMKGSLQVYAAVGHAAFCRWRCVAISVTSRFVTLNHPKAHNEAGSHP